MNVKKRYIAGKYFASIAGSKIKLTRQNLIQGRRFYSIIWIKFLKSKLQIISTLRCFLLTFWQPKIRFAGEALLYSFYLKPFSFRNLRTSISGFVFLPLIMVILGLIISLVHTSNIFQRQQVQKFCFAMEAIN